MTPERDPEAILAAWLDEGPTDLPDVTRRAIVAALPTTTQRRRPVWSPWRFYLMLSPVRLAAAAVIAVAVLGVIYFNLPNRNDVGGPSPSPSPTSTVVPSPTAAPTPGVFTSARYGYTLDYPGGIHSLPSTEDWPAERAVYPEGLFLDRFSGKLDLSSPTAVTYFTGIAAQPLPEGMSGDDWIAAHIQRNWNQFGDACGGRPEDWVATSIAGTTGRQVRADCGSGPETVTEIVFATADTGWVISGDTPLVEVLREGFRLPG